MEADGSVLCVVWSLTNLQPPLLTLFFFYFRNFIWTET